MKKIYSIIAVLIASVIVSACGEKDFNDKTYQGPLLVEFAKSVDGQSGTYLVEGGGAVFQERLTIQLIGAHQGEAINVEWEVDASSTAVDGVHYRVTSSSVVTIEAGSSFAHVDFEVLGDGFTDPDDIRDLVLNITNVSGAGADISVNGASVTQSMGITCPSNIPLGSWTNGNLGTVTLTSEGDGLYKFDSFNVSYYNPSNNPIEGFFQDICNTLTLYGSSRFGVQWRGTGTYDAATETITFAQVEDANFNPGIFDGPWVFTKD